MSLVQGFRTGFDIVDRYYRNEESDRRFDQQMGLQRRRMGMAEEGHEARMMQAGLNNQILQNQVDDIPDANQYRDKTRALSLQTAETQNDTAMTQNESAKFNLDTAKADRKKKQALERLNVYRASGDWSGFLQDDTFDGTNLELLKNGANADSAIALTDSISKNDVNGVVAHANNLFKSKLNRNVGKMKGRDGGVIRDISIVGFEQLEDGTTKLPVKVTTDKGVYTSYISDLRGIDPSDPDKQFTADQLFGTAAVMGNMAQTLKASGVYGGLNDAADRALGATNRPSGQVPAEVQTISMLSQMTGIPADELVRARYMSQKDPSGATLRKNALELAQSDPRWEDIQYAKDPIERSRMTQKIIQEYTGYLMGGSPESPAPRDLGDDPLDIR
tara:strand:+ start:122 stop:1288 length:1167 start_codon:yes stop_codon:yes gene_type:complete